MILRLVSVNRSRGDARGMQSLDHTVCAVLGLGEHECSFDARRSKNVEQELRFLRYGDLVELLLESLHESPLSDIEAAWDAEIVRRVDAYRNGEVETYAAEDVFAEARRIAP